MVGDLQKMVTFWGHRVSPNVQLDSTSKPTNYLKGVPEERLVLVLTTNINTGQLDNTGTFTRSGFYE